MTTIRHALEGFRPTHSRKLLVTADIQFDPNSHKHSDKGTTCYYSLEMAVRSDMCYSSTKGMVSQGHCALLLIHWSIKLELLPPRNPSSLCSAYHDVGTVGTCGASTRGSNYARPCS